MSRPGASSTLALCELRTVAAAVRAACRWNGALMLQKCCCEALGDAAENSPDPVKASRAGTVARWDGRFGVQDARSGQLLPRGVATPAAGAAPALESGFCDFLHAGDLFVGVPAMAALARSCPVANAERVQTTSATRVRRAGLDSRTCHCLCVGCTPDSIICCLGISGRVGA